MLGRHFHNNGYVVSYITGVFDGKREDETIEGRIVYKTCSYKDGIPGIRFVYPKITSLWKKLKAADADIYYQRCADYVTGVISLYCKAHGRIFVYSGSNDTNFIPRLIGVPYLRDKLMYSWGLRNASHVIVQSTQQQKLLFENFGIKGHVIKNVYEKKEITRGKKYVLWVSNLKKEKRPELILRIARGNPRFDFKMIGGAVPGQEGLFEAIRKEAMEIPNLEFLGFQPVEETERYFDGASLFISTSEIEGFPNTFLQSWARGIPTIAFFDPDHVISRNGLGVVVSSETEVDRGVLSLSDCSIDYRRAIRKYFNENHSPEKYVEKLDEILASPAGV